MHQLKTAAVLLCAIAAGNVLAQQPAAGFTPPPPKPAGFTPPNANVIDSIVVVVNDEVITRNELANRIKSVSARMQAQQVPLPPPAELRKQILERMIVERATTQLAKEMGVRIDDSQLDRALTNIAQQQKMSLQQFRDQLEKEGSAFASFREEIRDEIMMQRLQEHEVDNKIQISEAEVDTYMAAEEAAAKEQYELNLAQILIRIPENASPEQIAKSKAKADDVLRQLRTGADFAKMAATYSDAPDALKGGEVGWRQPQQLAPIFAEAVAKLDKGQVSLAIKSPTGFHILKATDKRSLAEAKEKIVVNQTHARLILIKVTPTVSADEAKRKLRDLKERLSNKAATFEELARLFSNDSSAAKGGDLGWLAPGDSLPEFETAMNALKPGEVSEVIETPLGICLIELVERKADDQSKERLRNAARGVLRDRKLGEAVEDWQRQVRDRAYVEFREEK